MINSLNDCFFFKLYNFSLSTHFSQHFPLGSAPKLSHLSMFVFTSGNCSRKASARVCDTLLPTNSLLFPSMELLSLWVRYLTSSLTSFLTSSLTWLWSPELELPVLLRRSLPNSSSSTLRADDRPLMRVGGSEGEGLDAAPLRVTTSPDMVVGERTRRKSSGSSKSLSSLPKSILGRTLECFNWLLTDWRRASCRKRLCKNWAQKSDIFIHSTKMST